MNFFFFQRRLDRNGQVVVVGESKPESSATLAIVQDELPAAEEGGQTVEARLACHVGRRPEPQRVSEFSARLSHHDQREDRLDVRDGLQPNGFAAERQI